MHMRACTHMHIVHGGQSSTLDALFYLSTLFYFILRQAVFTEPTTHLDWLVCEWRGSN